MPSSASSLNTLPLGFPMRAHEFVLRLTLGVLLLSYPLATRGQQPASSAPTPPPAAATTAPSDPVTPSESLLIGPGDLLRISVLREPELDQHVRVLDSGEITLSLAGNLSVQGLTPAQAATRIAGKYRDGGFLLHPEVAIFVEEYAT